MVTSRKPTVLSAKVPRATKPKAAKTEVEAPEWHPTPGAEYRVRLTAENPFGGFDRPTYLGDLFDAEMLHAEHVERGLCSIIEHASRYGYTPEPRQVVTIAELAKDHQAREREGNRWEISPEGQRRIFESMGLK